MTPESVGVQTNQMVLGKHSGKHAFSERLKELGYELSDDQIVDAFGRFKELCDKKKTVTDGDIEALVTNTEVVDGKYKLVSFDVKTMGKVGVCSSICLKHEDEFVEQKSLGDGAIDALYAAIDKIVQPPEHVLDKFNISAVSEGQDTLGEVTLKLNCQGKTYSGIGVTVYAVQGNVEIEG
jgi:2-isopropylmalate synthase